MESNKNLKLSNEDELLLYCARTKVDQETEGKIVSRVSEDLDWQYLLKMASTHRLTPLLYHNLNAICPKLVPENILGELKEYFNDNVRKNLLMTGELIKVLKFLKDNDIDAIPYKGPVLASLLYDNVALREFGDLDIFVNELDILNILDLLSYNGYKSDLPLKKELKDVYFKSQKNLVLINENSNFAIEFHWKLSGNFFSFPKIPESLFSKDLQTISINNHNIPAFSTENLFLILSIHAAGHHWSRLNWICDIAELIKINKLNWDEIIDKAGELKIKRIIYVNILLVKDILDVKIPEKILNDIKSDKLAKKISSNVQKSIFSENSDNTNLLGWILYHLQMREDFKNGIRDLIKYSTIPSIDEINTFKLSSNLYPLYHVFRPFYLIKNYKLFQ